MTTPSITPIQVQFGQTLAFAERTLTAALRQHLAKRQVVPETWYALKLIAAHGPGIAREAISRDLEGSPTMNADLTRELLTRLENEGLIHGDAELDLTAEGENLFHSLREYVLSSTNHLLSQLPTDDIETTVRTLQALTRLSEDELAAS